MKIARVPQNTAMTLQKLKIPICLLSAAFFSCFGPVSAAQTTVAAFITPHFLDHSGNLLTVNSLTAAIVNGDQVVGEGSNSTIQATITNAVATGGRVII